MKDVFHVSFSLTNMEFQMIRGLLESRVDTKPQSWQYDVIFHGCTFGRFQKIAKNHGKPRATLIF